MLPDVSKLRLDNGGAARKPAPTDDNLVPLSVLDEPWSIENFENWEKVTAQKACAAACDGPPGSRLQLQDCVCWGAISVHTGWCWLVSYLLA